MSTNSDNHESKQPPIEIGTDDWPAIVADWIVTFVDTIRSYTIDNIVLVARAAVYGLVAVAASATLVILATVASVRLTDAHLPIGNGVGSATWAAYALTGVLVLILGLGTWRARSSTARPIWIAVAIDTTLIIIVIFYGVIQAVT